MTREDELKAFTDLLLKLYDGDLKKFPFKRAPVEVKQLLRRRRPGRNVLNGIILAAYAAIKGIERREAARREAQDGPPEE